MVTLTSTKTKTKAKPANSSLDCSADCEPTTKRWQLSCSLTTSELRQRKETVIESLKAQVLQKKELKKGFAYRFTGTDKMVDELVEFVKTERACCHFFVFNLSISGDKSEAWLEITGPKGAKEFIKTELEL